MIGMGTPINQSSIPLPRPMEMSSVWSASAQKTNARWTQVFRRVAPKRLGFRRRRPPTTSDTESPATNCRLMTTSQSRTIATLMSDAAIVRMTSNCSNLINACTTFRHSCDQRGLHLRNKCAWQVLGLEGRAMVQPTDDHDQLRGVRVLVVEDDSLLAMDLGRP
jgi:hypothetical protein